MKTLIRSTCCFALLLSAAAIQAQTPSADATPPVKAKTAQQQKMGDCATQNKGKKGADYKSAMSACLKGGAGDAAPAVDADKTAKCEADAKSSSGKPLSGAAKTSFVKSCLKKAA